MMVGMQDFDVNDWEKHTIYKNYTKNAKQVQWFWQVSSPRWHLRTYVAWFKSAVRVLNVLLCSSGLLGYAS